MSISQGLQGFNSKPYAAWKGEVGDDRLFFAAFDGTTWGEPKTIPGNSSVGLGLAVFKGRIYAAWKGEEADQRLFFASFDGVNWSAQAQIPGVGSSIGPELAEFDGKLYALWKGENNDQDLYYASFDGAAWSSQTSMSSVGSSIGPTLCAFNGKLYAAWKGVSNDQGLYYASFNGSEWSSQTRIAGGASSIGPVLAEFDGKLYAMWKGENNDQRLFYAFFNGNTWSAQQTLPGNTGQDVPQNIGLRMQFQESANWCWIAVATSINHFYDPASKATQGSVMTGVIKELTGGSTSCSPSAAVLAANTSLANVLADPYSNAALNVLDSPAAGITGGFGGVCLKTGGVGDALDVNGNRNNPGGSRNDSQGSITLAQIQSEIAAGRPIAVDIAWKALNTGQHCVAIAGVLNDMLLICDPTAGETAIQYEDFPASYSSGATLVNVCLTRKG